MGSGTPASWPWLARDSCLVMLWKLSLVGCSRPPALECIIIPEAKLQRRECKVFATLTSAILRDFADVHDFIDVTLHNQPCYGNEL